MRDLVTFGKPRLATMFFRSVTTPRTCLAANEDLELYLNLNVGSTLALVMDITGSMGNEIAAARARFVDIVNSTRGTVDQPLLYVLSPYNSFCECTARVRNPRGLFFMPMCSQV